MTTPSDILLKLVASSGVLIPNPAKTGSEVCDLMKFILLSASLILRLDEPVTPLRVT